jgi:ring-1,2-phenylacetyl-CoA epoxidase subunit PaaB
MSEIVWEVFVQSEGGVPHEHAGSIHAADKELALQAARDVYARRGKVVNMWVVKASEISATEPSDRPSFFEPGDDKPYRHPSFYKVPRGLKGF